MEIRNQGRGLHAREIPGLAKLRGLPHEWYAFTNLELSIGPGQYREIDIVMVIEDRVLLVDLKDWNGRITSGDGRWYLGDRDMGISPVEKIRGNARKVAEIFKTHLRNSKERHSSTQPKLLPPLFQGIVVQSGKAPLDEIAGNETNGAFMLDEFVSFVRDANLRSKRLNVPQFIDKEIPLTGNDSLWRTVFERFFNAAGGQFKPGKRRYGSYRAVSDQPTFKHSSDAYAEFEVEDENAANAKGLLRRWDFSKLEGRFQTETGRNEIAGRERKVIAYLNDRNPNIGTMVLQPKVDDVERSVGYWEIFETRRRLKRLPDFIASEALHLSKTNRIELVRQFLARVKAIHEQSAAHLDLGPHSVWLEAPSVVRISHLLAARFPDVESLGEHRYKFLSAARTPEDVAGQTSDPRSKDCFLAGIVAHQLLFNVTPATENADHPPAWDSSVDESNTFPALHGWFGKSLSWNSGERFVDAGVMLDAFNLACTEPPTSGEVLARLESFRSWKTQRQVFSDLPCEREISVDDNREIWLSKHDGRPVLVKMWKRAAWGDQQTELPRLLDFLDKAETLRLSPPPGCVPIRKVCWMPDAIVLLRDWIDVSTLAEVIEAKTGALASETGSVRLLKQLSELVVTLHKSGIAHGDLKPSNVLVSTDGEAAPLLIDYIDFSAGPDGDIVSNAYAPIAGDDRFCRDRFAVTKIAEEVFGAYGVKGMRAIDIEKAIRSCRIGPPENATLLPLIDSFETILAPPANVARPKLTLSIKNAEVGPLLSDEGVFGLRFAKGSPILFIRGASEEIGIRLNDQGRPTVAWRKSLEQKQISSISRHEFARIELDVEVRSSTHIDLSEANLVLDDARFREAWHARTKGDDATTGVPEEGTEAVDASGDFAEDALAEAVEGEHPVDEVAVPVLWRALITAEEELTIEGTTAGDSAFRRDRGRHVARFELEQGTLDFNREDMVFVERLGRKGTWRELGILDIERSTPSLISIDATRRNPAARDGLIADETRLRFKSHFETTSRTRREAATTRILSRQSAVPDLIDHFDPQCLSSPSVHPKIVEADEIKSLYGLNDTQAEAFEHLTRVQPVGLLQGPPGTGKTRFIGALVHFALTRKLARNVLVASQSNDAVNNAAEAILALFDPNDGQPSIVRVGQEGSVSERLLPHHSGRVEASFKHRLEADLKSRMRLIGSTLGISSAASDQLTFVNHTVRPVVERYQELLRSGLGSEDNRLRGLRQTMVRMGAKIGLADRDVESGLGENHLLESMVRHVALEHSITNYDALGRFGSVTKLARDFCGSVSTRERSFETFLAGTRQIVAGTCVGLGRSSLGLTKTPFDLVVVDEAARCTASELAVPLQSGRWIVLVGDQAQLEPQHKPEVVREVAATTNLSKRDIMRSDFERMFLSGYGREAGRQLTQQYRMLAPIGRMVSASFYSQALTHERSKPIIDPSAYPESLGKVVTWVATDSGRARSYQKPDPDGGSSLINPVEADAILALLKLWDAHRPFRAYLDRQDPRAHTIGIVCMYAAQRDLIRHRLRIAGFSEPMRSNIVVGTVDSYQGKQNPIVILSLVRNNDDGQVEFGRATIKQGFMARPNRINVAISRAMDRLIVVGARSRWPTGGPMHRVAEAFARELQTNHARLLDAARLGGDISSRREHQRKPGHSKKRKMAKHDRK
jgi:tRNA A-37 threonylcarbamoyl transferase component Bud32